MIIDLLQTLVRLTFTTITKVVSNIFHIRYLVIELHTPFVEKMITESI